MPGYLSADITYSKMQTVFLEQSLRKTMSLIMSKDKYNSMFSHKIEAFVVIILQIYCNVHEKMFGNSLLFAVGQYFFRVFSGTTL